MNSQGGTEGENSSQEISHHYCCPKDLLWSPGEETLSSQDVLGKTRNSGFDSENPNNLVPVMEDSTFLAGQAEYFRKSNTIFGDDVMLQPIERPEGLFSQYSIGMAPTGNLDDSFGEFDHDSFEFKTRGEEINNRGYTAMQLPGLKTQDYAVAEDHQDERQDERLPVLERYGGKYAFRVIPAVLAGATECIFNSERNKVFCVDDHSILFHITLDFSAAPLKKLYVQAVIYYSANSMLSTNAERCGNCKEKNAQMETCIIRSDNPRARYYKRKGTHNCVAVPLEQLQPGADRILRNYIFKCKNSCHIKKGRDCRGWTLVFYLMEGEQEVGRDVYNLKVCKVPMRDQMKESSTDSVGHWPVGVTIPRKRKAPNNAAEIHLPPARKARMRKDFNLVAARRGAESVDLPPHPSWPLGSVASVCKDSQDTDSSCGEEEDFSTLSTKVNESMELAFAHRTHPDEVYRQFSANWINQLKNLDGLMQLYKTHIVKEGQLSARMEEVKEVCQGAKNSLN